MTIWRGEGGGGDATTDSEINFITSLTNSIAADTALTSANAAAVTSLYDSFDDRYLGSKAAAPTLDNDSNAFISGALYWNSVSNQMFVWSGTAWQQTFFSGTNVRSVVTATAGQTVVTTPTYTPGNNTIQVYVNGFKVISGTDYTETSTTSITFTSGLTLSDEVEILIAQPFSVGITSSDAVNYLPSGTGAVATTVQAKLREQVSVKDFGAVGDGVTNDTAAFTAALATGANKILVPAGNYRTTATIVLSLSGQRLVGASRMGSTILADFRGGPVIEIANSRCEIANLAISSLSGSARRNASPLGVTPPSVLVGGNSLDRGIYVNEVSIGTYTTYTRIEQCDVVYQPADGINISGAGSGTVITQVGISYCGGHGIYADDGDRDGAPKTRSGVVTIDNCIIQQCWGHGVALAIDAVSTVFRYALNELDIFSVCLGDGGVNQPAFYSTVKAAIAMKCENTKVTQCGVSAETGIIVGAANDVDLSSNRYVSCVNYGVIINPNCSRVVITNPYFFGAPVMGFRVQTGCDNVRIDGIKTSELSSATAIIDAESEVNCLINNKLVLTIPGSNSLFYVEETQSSTVASGICNIQAGRVEMIGEGNLVDSINVFRFASGIAVPDGYVFTVFNFNTYNLTLQDRTALGGSANIELQGTNAVLEPNESLVFFPRSGVYYAIGREVP